MKNSGVIMGVPASV